MLWLRLLLKLLVQLLVQLLSQLSYLGVAVVDVLVVVVVLTSYCSLFANIN